MSIDARTLATDFKESLLSNIIPFWLDHSIDKRNGGYFTSLRRDGSAYDTDKFMWLQARQVWMLSYLYEHVEQDQKWFDAAQSGILFILKNGRNANGNFYFSMDSRGVPLVEAYNIYSDCFAALAFYQFGRISSNSSYQEIATETYDKFIARLEDPKGQHEKSTGARPMRSFGLSMMTAYLSLQLKNIIPSADIDSILDKCIYDITQLHFDPNLGVLRENVALDGLFIDSYDGRLVNPGHGIEAMWFLMDIALDRNDLELFDWAADVCIKILEYSWDKEHGGIYYFKDAHGKPPQQLEHNQKLWWPHCEALIALSKIMTRSRTSDIISWYQKVHEYTFKYFPDSEYGEWFGYLDRKGKPIHHAKGGKWKGCYHVPRAMYECWRNFEVIAQKENTSIDV